MQMHDNTGKPISDLNPFPIKDVTSQNSLASILAKLTEILNQLQDTVVTAIVDTIVTTLEGSAVRAANTVTDADTTDRIISVSGGFNYINIINDGPSPLYIAVDDNSTTATILITVNALEGFSDAIKGSTIHYSTVAGGSVSFRYSVR